MLNFRRLFTTLILLGVLLGSTQSLGLAAPPPPPAPETSLPDTPPPPREEIDPALETAFLKSIQTITKSRTEVLAFVLFDVSIDHVEYAADGKTALLWLALTDPDTGEVIAAEPGLAIAKLDGDQKALADGSLPWEFTMQSDTDWQAEFSALPDDLMSEDLKTRFAAPTDEAKDVKTVYRGYKLPWAGGLGKRLTGSIGHFLIYNSCSEAYCRYAYDFADGTMFPLLASRGGTVYKFDYDCENGRTDCFNYLVLKDESTSPTTYQLYLHNAYESLPQELRQVGAKVVQGQYIGNVDDTGYSSGHHLHFMVHTNPYSYWGASVDVRFDDVPVNDGTPRTSYEATNWPVYGTGYVPNNIYVSQNYGANPPTANLIIPAPGEEITDTTMLVGGTASDDRGITKIEIMARAKDNVWRVISPAMTETTFLTEVDLCASGLPTGPIDIYARVFDYEGNQARDYPGFRTILNNSNCGSAAAITPPACNPNDNQVAVFSEVNYTGVCKLFDIGNYKDATTLSPVSDKDIESLLVGKNVRALLYQNTQSDSWNWGRSETFEVNDPNLEDNPIGLNRVSALRVMSKSNLPNTPIINPIFNNSVEAVTSIDSVVADFNAYGSTEIRATLTGPVNKTLDWTGKPSWSLGSLPSGSYTLNVWGRNSAGEKNATSDFFILPGTLSNTGVLSAPQTFNFDNGAQSWVGTGLWRHAATNYNNRTTSSWVYNNVNNSPPDIGHPTIGAGDLTSPPISIPTSGYYLRFDSLYQTEDFYHFWDQRWVQISVNGAPFENISQLYYDPKEMWLGSPAINLSAYSGKTIRIRFHFDIVDGFNNGGYLGWLIDNVSITNQAPLTCQSTEPNNNISQATPFPSNNEVFAHICPNGDLDYFSFSGLKGEQIALDVDAMEFGSSLDPYLFLFDSKGRVLASNDDEVYSVYRDSKITHTLPDAGTYYAMVKAWDHPNVGDGEYYYTLRLYKGDLTPPQVSFLVPLNSLIPSITFPVQVNASDGQNIIQRVDFYYRDGDAINSNWNLISSDTVGSDGWTANFNPALLTTVKNSMLFVEAFDLNNNHAGVLMVIDGFGTGEPQSQLNPLNGEQKTTLLNLTWWANNPISGIKAFDIQVQENGGAWQDLVSGLSGALRRYIYFGNMGNSYNFRIRAIDYNDQTEAYPDNPEVSVKVNSCSSDSFESDNELANAVYLPLKTYQSHNFCQTNDVDWIKFDVEAGKKYMILAVADGSTAAVAIQLYTDDGIKSAADITPLDYGMSSTLFWTAEVNETIYARLQPPDSRLAGDDVKYRIWVGEPSQTFLPLTTR
ncbi:MAG: hypothetical protein CL609_17970 [Anaerolineaceae bacterium]|nr:hypothetical protein [Anaerolineaceae bacterium]